MLKGMVDSNPQVKSMLTNPVMLQQMMSNNIFIFSYKFRPLNY